MNTAETFTKNLSTLDSTELGKCVPCFGSVEFAANVLFSNIMKMKPKSSVFIKSSDLKIHI